MQSIVTFYTNTMYKMSDTVARSVISIYHFDIGKQHGGVNDIETTNEICSLSIDERLEVNGFTKLRTGNF